jgi:prepilin-type N-terminal cleavage/methylation domain-containing protein
LRRSGFSLVELTVVLSILAIVVPLMWKMAARIEDQRALALDHLESAEEAQTVSEQLALDLRLGSRITGETLAFRRSECEVRYRVGTEGVLIREAPAPCGGDLALARGVEVLRSVPGGVELVLALRLRADWVERTVLFFPVPG